MATACNHSLDYGEEGITSTIEALRSNRIAFHGVNESERDAGEPTVVDVKGIRIGVISYAFGLNAKKPPATRPRIVNRMRLNASPEDVDFSLVDRQLARCKELGVDFVVAQLHWGMEYELYPRPEQIALAHHLAEMGVDAIFGHHPHVVQPYEHYRTQRDPLRVVPIFYSLGNLTNPFSAPILCKSAVARLSLAKGVLQDGTPRTYVQNAEVHEVVQEADHVARTLSLRRVEGRSR
jgi:poly-gamma-glutamate synthesis protein (capsule biosynthesis protein)